MDAKNQAIEIALCGEPIDWTSGERFYFIKIKNNLDARISTLRGELATERRRRAARAPWAGMEWMRHREEEVAAAGRLSQQLQARVAELKAAFAANNSAEHKSFAAAFIRIAKMTLTGEQFEAIVTKAQAAIKAAAPETPTA